MNNCKGNIGKCTCNSSSHPGDKSACGCGEFCRCAEQRNKIIEGDQYMSRAKEEQL